MSPFCGISIEGMVDVEERERSREIKAISQKLMGGLDKESIKLQQKYLSAVCSHLDALQTSGEMVRDKFLCLRMAFLNCRRCTQIDAGCTLPRRQSISTVGLMR